MQLFLFFFFSNSSPTNSVASYLWPWLQNFRLKAVNPPSLSVPTLIATLPRLHCCCSAQRLKLIHDWKRLGFLSLWKIGVLEDPDEHSSCLKRALISNHVVHSFNVLSLSFFRFFFPSLCFQKPQNSCPHMNAGAGQLSLNGQ